MKKLSFLAIFSLMLVVFLGSCKPKCKTCTATSVAITDNGGTMDTISVDVPAVEYCDEALTLVDGKSIDATAGSTTTTITYTCVE